MRNIIVTVITVVTVVHSRSCSGRVTDVRVTARPLSHGGVTYSVRPDTLRIMTDLEITSAELIMISLNNAIATDDSGCQVGGVVGDVIAAGLADKVFIFTIIIISKSSPPPPPPPPPNNNEISSEIIS